VIEGRDNGRRRPGAREVLWSWWSQLTGGRWHANHRTG